MDTKNSGQQVANWFSIRFYKTHKELQ